MNIFLSFYKILNNHNKKIKMKIVMSTIFLKTLWKLNVNIFHIQDYKDEKKGGSVKMKIPNVKLFNYFDFIM